MFSMVCSRYAYLVQTDFKLADAREKVSSSGKSRLPTASMLPSFLVLSPSEGVVQYFSFSC